MSDDQSGTGREIVQAHFPEFSEKQLDQLEHYVSLLTETNQHINLVSRKDIDQAWIRHILHSLAIAKAVQFTPEQSVADVGTGGGLPGIPLAIAFPETQFTLIDSIGKKIRAVNGMLEELKLDNVRTLNARMESVPQQFDFVVSRAVSALPQMMEWLKGKIRKGEAANLKNGLVYIKGGDFDEELLQINRPFRIWSLDELFEDPFFETKKVVWVGEV